MFKAHIFIFLCLLIPAGAHASTCWDATIVGILDGNTLQVTRNRTPVTVRLFGIQAPTGTQPGAADAVQTLHDLLINTKATLCAKKTAAGSAYEINVLKGFMRNVNSLLVRKGLARSKVQKYAASEAYARKHRLGIWSGKAQQARRTPDGQASHMQKKTGGGNTAGTPSVGGLSVYKSNAAEATRHGKSLEQIMLESEAQMQRREELDAARQQEVFRDDYEPQLTDIDQVEIDTYFDFGERDIDGAIEISLYYSSANLGRHVYWEDGQVNCDCRVTGHFSNGTNTRIAKSSDILNSHRERVFIKIPAYYLDKNDFVVLRNCTVECRVSAGIFDLKASDKFEVFFQEHPDFYNPYQ